jgi:hypothetical protein
MLITSIDETSISHIVYTSQSSLNIDLLARCLKGDTFLSLEVIGNVFILWFSLRIIATIRSVSVYGIELLECWVSFAKLLPLRYAINFRNFI